jgi:tripartite-type tricarboxylate transporter receptor subunit TctC
MDWPMNSTRRDFLRFAASSPVFSMVGGAAKAETFPSRPITMIVPFLAGNGNDILGRAIAERMRSPLGQPVIVENVSGANGSIGVGRIAHAAPDGYTVGLGAWGTHVLNAALYTLTYDTLRDFEPVSLIGDTPMLIVSKKAMPADDLAGLIAWLRSNPDRAIAGNGGQGSAGQLTATLFQQMTGTRLHQVPYRGGPQALNDLIAGRIDLINKTGPARMFTIVILVHAVSSGWEDTVEVNPKYPSLEMCEAARPDVAEGYRQFLERRLLQRFEIESKCVRQGNDA